ncbi:hypothetical protein, partial [Photorhabdus australis]|uniref:hypothetical protein n=1 Tax=Photorhabdus australis TaxID=286156 RepID=UPI00196A0C9E
ERIPGSIDNYVTGVSECSQQRGNLKDDGYNCYLLTKLFLLGVTTYLTHRFLFMIMIFICILLS